MHWEFMAEMTGFTTLLASGANAIVTLEGQNTTCANVFYAWVCIAYDLEQVLSKVTLGVGKHRSNVISIYNHRFTQMMNESSHKLFLLGYYLHPCKFIFFLSSQSDQQILVFRHHGGLQLTMPVLADGQKLETMQYPTLFHTLLQSVLQIFKGEQYRLWDSGQEAVPQLIKEFINYAYNKEPRMYKRRHTHTDEEYGTSCEKQHTR